MLQERAERKWEAEERREAADSLVMRLANLAGSAAASRNYYRVTDSGSAVVAESTHKHQDLFSL